MSMANWRAFAASSTAIPTNCSPAPACSRWAFTNIGISSRHGAHHVAQKLTTTSLPRHWASDWAVPSTSGSVTASSVSPSGTDDWRMKTPESAPASNATTPPTASTTISRDRDAGREVNARPLLEPRLLRRLELDQRPRLAVHRGNRQRDALRVRRIAHAGVGAALGIRAKRDRLARRGPRQRQADDDTVAIGLHAAKELVVLHLAGRKRRVEHRAGWPQCEADLVAVQVVAPRNAEVGFQRPRVQRARRESECLVGRKQL